MCIKNRHRTRKEEQMAGLSNHENEQYLDVAAPLRVQAIFKIFNIGNCCLKFFTAAGLPLTSIFDIIDADPSSIRFSGCIGMLIKQCPIFASKVLTSWRIKPAIDILCLYCSTITCIILEELQEIRTNNQRLPCFLQGIATDNAN